MSRGSDRSIQKITLMMLALNVSAAHAELTIHTDFPGGSARVQKISQQRQQIHIAPTAFNGRGWNCWWYFRVDGANPDQTLELSVSGMSFARPDRAVFSTDRQNWKHTTPARTTKGTNHYTFKPPADSFWLAWGPPFLIEHAEDLVTRADASCDIAKAFTLTRSSDGHDIPALHIKPDQPTFQLWIQARQHAWESGSSWVCKGLTDWLISTDSAATALRRRAEIVLVPIMDVDNVQRGAGGKNQFPQDHNRDWSPTPHWPEVAAAQKWIKKMDMDDQFILFIDLHNPAPNDKELFYFLPPAELLSERRLDRQNAFIAQSTIHMSDAPLSFKGLTKVSGRNYDKNWSKISKNWVAKNTQSPTVAVTLETSWNTPDSTVVNYQKTGAALGRAIAAFVNTLNEK